MEAKLPWKLVSFSFLIIICLFNASYCWKILVQRRKINTTSFPYFYWIFRKLFKYRLASPSGIQILLLNIYRFFVYRWSKSETLLLQIFTPLQRRYNEVKSSSKFIPNLEIESLACKAINIVLLYSGNICNGLLLSGPISSKLNPNWAWFLSVLRNCLFHFGFEGGREENPIKHFMWSISERNYFQVWKKDLIGPTVQCSTSYIH